MPAASAVLYVQYSPTYTLLRRAPAQRLHIVLTHTRRLSITDLLTRRARGFLFLLFFPPFSSHCLGARSFFCCLLFEMSPFFLSCFKRMTFQQASERLILSVFFISCLHFGPCPFLVCSPFPVMLFHVIGTGIIRRSVLGWWFLILVMAVRRRFQLLHGGLVFRVMGRLLVCSKKHGIDSTEPGGEDDFLVLPRQSPQIEIGIFWVLFSFSFP